MDHRRHPRSNPPRHGRPRTSPALQDPREVIAGATVVIAGLFSARRKDHVDLMDELEAEVTNIGGRVVARFVQRRGISGNKKGHAAGGTASMDQAYSGRTLMSAGKVREIAEACTWARADAVVFHNRLTERQRKVLAEIFGCAVFGLHELRQPPREGRDGG
jgi:50S ribosomal subunit-associated GTPase HflX